MSKIDISKAYQFLASFGKDDAWKDLADGCGTNGQKDGTIIKSEFRAFMKENFASWNGESNTTREVNDLVDRFWGQIDTNTSEKSISGTHFKDLGALNNDELANLGNKLDVYVAFDEYIKNLKVPDFLKSQSAEWKKNVRDELSSSLEEYIKNGGTKDGLEKEFNENYLPAAQNKCTAKLYAEVYGKSLSSTLLKDFKDFDIKSDETLQKIINEYLDGVDENTTPEQIKEDIENILNGYLATAGIGSGDTSALDKYYTQEDDDALNPLQAAKVKKELLEKFPLDKDEYPEELEKAINEFISNLTYSELKSTSDVTDLFKNSDSYDKYKKTTDIYKLFSNTEWDEEAQNTDYSENIKNILADEIGKLAGNESLMDKVVDKVLNGDFIKDSGDLDTDSIKKYAIEQYILLLSQKTHTDYSKEELEDLYNTAAGIDPSLESKRKSALAICDSLASFGQNHSSVVQEYRDMIENANRASTIDTNMKTLFEKIKNVKETSSTDSVSGGNAVLTVDKDIDDNFKSGYLESNKYSENKNVTAGTLASAKADGIGQVRSYVQDLKDSLLGKGKYNAAALEEASTKVIEYFTAFINASGDAISGVGHHVETCKVNFSANGKDYTEDYYRNQHKNNAQRDDSRTEALQYVRKGRGKHNSSNPRYDQLSIRKDAILAKFIEYYNEALSS